MPMEIKNQWHLKYEKKFFVYKPSPPIFVCLVMTIDCNATSISSENLSILAMIISTALSHRRDLCEIEDRGQGSWDVHSARLLS